MNLATRIQDEGVSYHIGQVREMFNGRKFYLHTVRSYLSSLGRTCTEMNESPIIQALATFDHASFEDMQTHVIFLLQDGVNELASQKLF